MKYIDAIATFWQRNAEIRHGHVPRTSEVQGPVAVSSPEPSLIGKAAPFVLSAVLGGGGVAALPWLLDLVNGRTDSPPAVGVQEAPANDGSLYQYLEDQNLHLPE